MIAVTKIFPLLLLTFTTSIVIAQTKNKISGTIENNKSAPVALASVALLKSEDSSSLRTISSDEKGYFEFSGVNDGKYLVKITSVSFEPFYTTPIEAFRDSSVKLRPIKLNGRTVTLKTVVVESVKPPIENKLDKMIVNVNASPTNAGINALEVLAKTPGVSVDREGNISLKGKQGVNILIDGKPTYLSTQELATLLKGIPSSQLNQIEIMTQPSAQYDAEGNSGVLNLKMAKSRQAGFNGNLSLSYSQGKYARFPNSFNFNYNNQKISFYSSFAYSIWTDFTSLILQRKFFDANKNPSSFFYQNSDVKFRGYNYTARTSLDYSINKKTKIGMAVNGIFNSDKSTVHSISNIFDGKNNLDSIGATNGFRNGKLENFGLNLNFEKNIDSAGRKLSINADYIHYRSTNDQKSNNYVTRPDGSQSDFPLFLRAFLPSNITIYSTKIDYVHPLTTNAKIEAGIKSSVVKIDNQAPYQIYSEVSSLWETDSTRADYFRYSENISATYLNFSQQFKKWSLQAGLRYEQTSSTGEQVLKAKSYPRSYAQLFPTLYLGYNISKKNQLVFSYGRRINRPNYQDMNPFQRFLDKFTFIQGNPFLKPQFTNNIELSHQYNNKLYTTLNYTFTNDIINDVLVQNDSTKVTYRTKGNIGTNSTIGIAANYNTSIASWWSINVFANFYKNYYNGLLNNVPLKVDAANFITNLNSQFKFAKSWTGELTGSFRSRMLEGGIYSFAPRSELSIGFARQILKNNGMIRINFVDPFNLQMSKTTTKYGNIDVDITSHWDNRRISVGFTYKFRKGSSKSRQNNNETLEEQRRVN